MLLLKVLAAFILWLFIGTMVIEIGGIIMGKKLEKFFRQMEDPRKETDRYLIIRTLEKGGEPHPEFGELFMNALFWPITEYYAIIGYRNIRNELIKQEETKND